MIELWKPVHNYTDTYEVSDLGVIRSIPRVRLHPSGGVMWDIGKILKPFNSGKGYHQVRLCRDKIQIDKKVHRLVARAFCFGYSKELQVNHINEIRTDNRAVNLEWVTQAENLHKASKILDWDTVADIRATYKEGVFNQRDLAKIFGISQPMVSCIIRNTQWVI